ncbi:MAG TPA: hypothetical protein VM433_07150 [Mycobacteriales bacterium]|nr:hypothetical protein [Mycobacteriales bacterium]
MRARSRQSTYLLVRGGAALGFLLSSVALPHGVLSGLLVMAAGLVAVFACIGINAGGPGERAGTVPQDRWLSGVRAPQGDWPPFDPDRVVEGELADRREA